MKIFEDLIANPKLFSRQEALSKPCPIPKKPGLYGWYFREIPEGVPVDKCKSINGYKLLYVGISPSSDMSSQDLRLRISTHFRGNAQGSNLRLMLGVLLENQSGFPLSSNARLCER